MKQRERVNIGSRTRAYDVANRECALIILADVEKFGAGMTRWAEMIIGRARTVSAEPTKFEQLSLLEAAK